jgi:hypothetical protein
VAYTIDFSLTQDGPLPTSGSFDYDSSTSTFTSFDVVWDGDTFDLTATANSFAFSSPTDPCYAGATTGAQEVFLLMTTCSNDNNPAYDNGTPYYLADIYPYGSPEYSAFGFYADVPGGGGNIDGNGVYAYGTATSICPPETCYTYSVQAVGGFDATPVPEPGSYALMLAGLGWLMRKRIARSLL